VGNGIRKLIERAVPCGTSVEAIDRVHTDFTAHYEKHCGDSTRPYAGIPELLAGLRAAGCRTAVVSNKADYAVQELCRQYFPDQLDAAVGERSGVRKKPAPDAVNAVLCQLAVPKECAVYIGDSDVDILTAENVGMDAVIVDWGFRDREFLAAQGAKVIVSDPQALSAILLQP
jgi:phosphoglycolate phosphatase